MLEALIIEKEELASTIEKFKEELEAKNGRITELEEEVEILQLEKEEGITDRNNSSLI
jgi:hypothetical protein